MPSIVISGAGIAGLILAISLQNIGLECTVLEQAPGFEQGVGGAIGLYPNGLKIIRDLSPELLCEIRKLGRPYTLRKWMRNDGSEVAIGQERFITKFDSEKDERELGSMGIRRWRLQKALMDEVRKRNITIRFNERVDKIQVTNTEGVRVILQSGTEITCDLMFGCDGVKSATRQSLFGSETEPRYTVINSLPGNNMLDGLGSDRKKLSN